MPAGTPQPMRASTFQARLGEAARIADRLTDEAGGADFGPNLAALEDIVDELAPYARAGGQGAIEVDIEAYMGEGGGGAPAFLRDQAMTLLNVATVLQRAREAWWALDDDENGDETEGNDGASDVDDDHAARRSRPDLRFARTARTAYTADEVRTLQRAFRFLYSRRAYEKLKKGGIYRRALKEGRIWGEQRSIVGLSHFNLRFLRRKLLRLTEAERKLHERLHALPFRLIHASRATARAAIANTGMLWSLDSLMDWYVSGKSGFTTPSDIKQKMDMDFVFFRLDVGEGAITTRYGEAQFVFTLDQVLDDGWATLHDMLAPIESDTLRNLCLRTDGTVVRKSGYIDDGAWWNVRWEHEVCDPAGAKGQRRRVHILDEVFYGPDILEGLVLSIVRDLRDLPTLQREVFAHLDDAGYLQWLVGALYRVEAKYPSSFRFNAETLVREHRKPPIIPPALKVAK